MNKKQIIISIAVLLCLLILAYGLKMNQRGYQTDDWLTLFVVENKGPAGLVEHYSIDRPLRGYLFKYMTILLGTKMQHYQLLGLAVRFLDTGFFFAILMLLFPKRFLDNLLASMLVLIYPGFLQQPNALDYQAQFISHMTMIASFLICILPIYFQKKWLNILAIPISIGLFQVSVGIMELFIGMDLWRYYLIYLALRYYSTESPLKFRTVAFYISPYAISTAAFFIWRMFFFETQRVTVDSAQMLQNLTSLDGILNLISSLAQNLYRLTISAWYQPFSIYSKALEKDTLLPLIAITAAASAVVVGLYWMSKTTEKTAQNEKDNYGLLLIIGGLIFAIGSLIPIVFGGREISFESTWNRFSFPGMMGSVMVIIGLLSWVRAEIKYPAVLVLVLVSLTVHFGNTTLYAKNYEAVRTTWWQLTWRAPDIIPRSTLTGKIEEGRLIESPTIWGPVNMIYYPGRKFVIAGAEILNEQTRDWIYEKAVVPQVKRLNGWDNDFGQLLVFSREADSCLHVFDGRHLEISEFSDPLVVEVAAYSQIGRIDPGSDKELRINPEIFGPEPAHGWCYYYQKAQLARQARDWDTTASLGEQVIEQKLKTNDGIEWLVFVQGLAYTQSSAYNAALGRLLEDDYAARQACEVYTSFSDEMAVSDYQSAHENLLADVCE